MQNSHNKVHIHHWNIVKPRKEEEEQKKQRGSRRKKLRAERAAKSWSTLSLELKDHQD